MNAGRHSASAYHAGRRAHARGIGAGQCPHPDRTAARTAWMAGWCHRRTEMTELHAPQRTRPSGRRGAPDDPSDNAR